MHKHTLKHRYTIKILSNILGATWEGPNTQCLQNGLKVPIPLFLLHHLRRIRVFIIYQNNIFESFGRRTVV